MSKNYVQEIENKTFDYEGNEKDSSTDKIITNRVETTTKRHCEGELYDNIYTILTINEESFTATVYDLDKRTYNTDTLNYDAWIMEFGAGSVDRNLAFMNYNFGGVCDSNYNELFKSLIHQYKDESGYSALEYSFVEDKGYIIATCVAKVNKYKWVYTVSIDPNGRVSMVKVEHYDDVVREKEQFISTFRYTGDDLMISVNTEGFTQE